MELQYNSQEPSYVSNDTATGAHVKRESPIYREFGELTCIADILEKEISELASRLIPVLEPDTPRATNGEKSAADSPMSPLAASFRDEASRLRHQISRLTGLRLRIEL